MASSSRRVSMSFCTPDFQICIVGESLKQNENLIKAVDTFNIPIVYSETGQELISQRAEFATIFILSEFEGEVYDHLHKSGQRILGPTCAIEFAEKHEPLPNNIRPLFATSMRNLSICFTGFRVKEELTAMVTLIHNMGGGIRKDFSFAKTSHLIANSTTTEKYRYAASLGVPIMTAEWVQQLWSRRFDSHCSAISKEMMQYKMLPFVGCKMALIGYQEDEKQHMIEVSSQNGGSVVEVTDPSCTHIVIEDGFTVDISEFSHQLHIVKNEWFWACIQMEAKAEEQIYMFENPNAAIMSSSLILPVKGNKRKRLENVARQLAMENAPETDYFSFNHDHTPKPSEVARLSISGSFLDATLSPDKSHDAGLDTIFEVPLIKSPPLDVKMFSPRQHVCLELFQTETNYVGILNTIMTVFKEPLEQPDQVGGALLAPAEIKIIFGNLPLIYNVHRKIRSELAEIIYSWSEDSSIGNMFLSHAQEFLKAYPPFVNFFEKTKQVLAHSDATKPRFHAFLKRCQSRPECGRQTLQELLIRPVQRLPSVILLLNDILKHTPKSSDDHQALERAIQAVKEVLTHINEDKRKTEGQVAMFDIVNDIENCPPILLSSHRNFIAKADMQELTDLLSRRGGVISMFLFTDVLEICKKRTRTAILKSPGAISLSSASAKAQPKSFRHIELIPLSQIKRIVDITETEDCKNVFAIVVRSNKDLKELLYAFMLIDEVCKSTFLRTLSRQVANSVCKADAENLLTNLDPQQLALQSSDCVAGNALTKAFSKTRIKLGRALSLRKTPSKRGLSRAVSSIISPLMSIGSPSNTLRHTLRLSSVTNLNPCLIAEAMFPFSSQRFKPIRAKNRLIKQEEELVPNSSPSSSPVGGKKMKSCSLGVSAVKI